MNNVTSLQISPDGECIQLPTTLRQRILNRSDPIQTKQSGYILYLPTVVLRKRHNPGFTLACHLSNHYNIPLIVLCTVLDDKHLSSSSDKDHPAICQTARRLAFYLEALESCCREWESHGAGVAIRIHGPGTRTPHHLTLANQAMAVVTDEGFVEPYLLYNERIFRTCIAAKVPCWSVDGSTTVPPISILTRTNNGFTGVPAKAWLWEKKTEPQRKSHVYAATRQGHLDAPSLNVRMQKSFFRHDSCSLMEKPPFSTWKRESFFAVEDLEAKNLKEFSTSWIGSDPLVAPSCQTHGSIQAGKRRWKHFLETQLKDYAKRRNQIVQPHAVSRISCYLNLGILSIFDVISDVWNAKENRGYSTGCQKFIEEVVKWREIGYCYTLANPSNYEQLTQAIPNWALVYLENRHQQGGGAYTYQQLESASTKDEIWNAMQTYLIETGELHNNARMTWGKTVVHWQASGYSPQEVLRQLCCLNDRFALDGLSPPSYAGILWCFGWGDKPGSGMSVTTKWAHRYRTGPDGFAKAKENLLAEYPVEHHKRKGSTVESRSPKKTKPISSFFSPVNNSVN